MQETIQNIWFKNRNQSAYLDLLLEKLNVEYLMDTAIAVEEKTQRFKKIIRIDFSGIAATTLFINKRINEKHKDVNKSFLSLFEKLDFFAKNKVRLKTRLLFSYLYSDFAFALIESERTMFRATIENPANENRNYRVFSLTKDDFVASTIFQNQKRTLKKVEDIYNKYYRSIDRSDILNIRFSCLPLNFCQLTINNDTFLDPYSFAKPDELSPLSFETPLIHLSSEKNKETFDAVEDHFRYIWIHPTTLFYEDATNAGINVNAGGYLEGLSEFKEPGDVLFEKKTQKFKETYKGLNDSLTDEELNRWKFKVERMFNSMTRKIESPVDSETLFIGFSFIRGKTIAGNIKDYIKEDFLYSININVVDVWSKGNNPLYQELMKNMNEATIGLILFTKDIEENSDNEKKFHSRPNLYFEYGYLMKQVEKFGAPLRRVMIMAEDRSVIPTDMQDMPREELTTNTHITYKHIIKRLLEVTQTLTQAKAERAVNSYLQRLQSAYNDNFLTEKDFRGKSFNEFIRDIKNELDGKIYERFGKKR